MLKLSAGRGSLLWRYRRGSASSSSSLLYGSSVLPRPAAVHGPRNHSSQTRESGDKSPTPLCRLAEQADRQFSIGEVAYRSKSTGEILRALVVYKICSWNWFVKHNQKLMTVGRRVLGAGLFARMMKATAYGQFVAGESHISSQSLLKRNYAHNVSAILHYSAESDKATGGVMDDQYDENAEHFMSGILGVRGTTSGTGFVGVKVTGLGPVDALKRACTALEKRQELFEAAVGKDSDRDLLQADLSEPSGKALFEQIAKHYGKNSLNLFEWTDMTIVSPDGQDLVVSGSDRDALVKMFGRAEKIVKFGNDNAIKVVFDAEQTYYQSAIYRHVYQDLMRKYNQDGRLYTWGTYQGYLKGTNGVLKQHLDFSRKEGFGMGVRCVRGAYLEQEREVALAQGYEDPTQPTYDATTASYFRNVDMALEEICQRPNVCLLVASHDEKTVEMALDRLSKLPSDVLDDRVRFGQVLGMSDHVSFSLGNSGLRVHKACPFGPVPETLKYLGRRAIENSGLFQRTQKERQMLWAEFKRRWRSRRQ